MHRSNIEPLMGLNVERNGRVETLEAYVNKIADLLGETRD